MASLFGPTPQEIIYARMKEDEKMRMLRDQQISQEGSQFGVFAPLYQAGRRFGEMGSKAIVSGLFPEAISPDLRRAQATESILAKYQGQDLSDPTVLKQIGGEFLTAGVPEAGIKALTLSKQLAPEKKLTNVAPGGTVINEKGEVVFTAPDKESMVKTPADFAAAGKELGFGVRPNIGDYTQEETRAINNLLEVRGIKKAEAGVPKSGEVKLTDLATASKIVGDFTDKPREKLSAVGDVRSQLDLVKAGNGAALPQLQRQLVRLVGDNQIAFNETKAVLGSAGIVGDTINALEQFVTGTPTLEKLSSIEQVVDALEQVNADALNRGIKRSEIVLGEAKLSPETRKSLIPPAYETAADKKKKAKQSGFVEGKIYVDAQGNRARYVNGKWQSVQ